MLLVSGNRAYTGRSTPPPPPPPRPTSALSGLGLECRSGPSDAGSDLPDLGDTVTRVATQASSAAIGPNLRRWRSVRGAGGLAGFEAGEAFASEGGFFGAGEVVDEVLD